MMPKTYYRVIIYDAENLERLKIIGFNILKKNNLLHSVSARKSQSNIDKIPYIGDLIFEIKEKLRLSSEDTGLEIHQLSRYIKRTRIPTRNTVSRIFTAFAQRFVALQRIQPSILTDGSINLEELCLEIGISKTSLAMQLQVTPYVLTTLMNRRDNIVIEAILQEITKCTCQEVEKKLLSLAQLVFSDVIWERIVSIEDRNYGELYDFEAEGTHNFIANNIVVHNSMLGLGLAEMLPKEKLVDTVSFPNPNDENMPLIRTMPAGKGRDLVFRARIQTTSSFKNQTVLLFIVVLIVSLLPYYFWRMGQISDIIFAASMMTGIIFIIGFMLFLNLNKRMSVNAKESVPKVIVDNFNQKHAPFMDATGAHAGALLGDVLHDPFQSLNGSNKITIIDDKSSQKIVTASKLIDNLFVRHAQRILKKRQDNYEAIHLPKNELFVLGETGSSVSPVEVLSCNRYDYNGEMIKLTTSENEELIVTPEHKIAVWKNNGVVYVEAKNIEEDHDIVSKSADIIIDEQDIINTYDERQQEQCRLYYQYLDVKAQNSSWGYKRIAKSMSQKIGKTRWWHAKKHIPVPIRTANWLKKQGLLPLKANNLKLPLIAKVLGATFGDGGIFENLNGIFLSSSEKEAVEDFGRDIEKTFGLNMNENSRVIEGGEYGHSWCYQNTNRNIIRFFLALGAPKGSKSSLELKIPSWIYLKDEFKDQFFSSFLGGEIGIPKTHVNKFYLNTFDIAITGIKKLEKNRYEFMSALKAYLNGKRVDTTSIKKRKTEAEDVYLYRLLISTKIDNLIRFIRNLKINYCYYKKEKLVATINEFMGIKKTRYEELLKRGYGAETCMKLLNLTPNSLYEILNNKRFVLRNAEA